MSGKKARRARKSGGGGDPDSKWTMNDLRAIIHNPAYAGLGSFPPLVDEATWVRVQEREIRDDGAAAVLLQVRRRCWRRSDTCPYGWLRLAG